MKPAPALPLLRCWRERGRWGASSLRPRCYVLSSEQLELKMETGKERPGPAALFVPVICPAISRRCSVSPGRYPPLLPIRTYPALLLHRRYPRCKKMPAVSNDFSVATSLCSSFRVVKIRNFPAARLVDQVAHTAWETFDRISIKVFETSLVYVDRSFQLG